MKKNTVLLIPVFISMIAYNPVNINLKFPKMTLD